MPAGQAQPHVARPWARLLLLIVVIVALWVPFYNRARPMLAGIPFFYWFQLLWVAVSAFVTGLVYRLER